MSGFGPRHQPSSRSSYAYGGNAGATLAAASPGAPPTQAAHLASAGPQQQQRPQAATSSANSAQPYVIEGPSGRILCIADIRGLISSLNTLAAQNDAQAILHTGDFGFYDNSSLERISDKTLRHLVQYSPLLSAEQRNRLLNADQSRPGGAAPTAASLRSHIATSPTPTISEFPLLAQGRIRLNVPVFTVWGACEDVSIIESLRMGSLRIPNLQIIDEATSRAIEVGGVRLRLLGLGGAVVLHKLFDNGDGAATIAGGQGTMWTTLLQIGELVDTAQRTFDPSETRVLLTHAPLGREGLLGQLALAVNADFTISAGLHFRYGVSYNEFSVQHDATNYRNKLLAANSAFKEIWETVKTQVESSVDEHQKKLLSKALSVTERIPQLSTASGAASEEPAWKSAWNWNLPDAAFGSLLFDVKDGRMRSEMRSQGFSFAYRKQEAAAASRPAPPPSAPNVKLSDRSAAVTQGPGAGASIPAPYHQRYESQNQHHTPANTASAQQAPRGPPSGPAAAVRSPPTGPAAGLAASSAPRGGFKNRFEQSKNGSPAQRPAAPSGPARESDGGNQKRPGGNKNGLVESGGQDIASGPKEVSVTKAKQPRGGKKIKGVAGTGSGTSGAEGGETSGAEGITSGADSSKDPTAQAGAAGTNAQKKPHQKKDKTKEKEKLGQQPKEDATSTGQAADRKEASAATVKEAAAPAKPSATGEEPANAAAAAVSSNESGNVSGGERGRGRGRGGRGRGAGGERGGRGRGRGGRGGGAASGGEGATAASPAPAPATASAPAAAS